MKPLANPTGDSAASDRKPQSISFDAEQRQVVEMMDESRHVLVVAPPGSGKTLTITQRIAHLLENKHAKPEEILALTFTERAAEELAARLDGSVRPGVSTNTFHGWCLALLQKHGPEIGIKTPVTLLSDTTIKETVRDSAAAAGLPRINDQAIRNLVSAISLWKREQSDVSLLKETSRFNEEITTVIIDEYQRRIRELGALDFDDLILRTIELLWTMPEIADACHQRYRFVFVDEFQDVSIEQYRLLTVVAPPTVPNRQVIVVADQNQAIFGFRGADAELMLNHFRFDFQPMTVHLRSNHRSVANVVKAAHQLMARANLAEVSRETRDAGFNVDYFEFENEQVEASAICKLVSKALKTGYRGQDIAVLYRRHKRADALEQQLLEHDLAVFRIRPGRFLDQPDAREILRYLELVRSLTDQQFEQAVNWPRFLVDELTMADMRRIARQQHIRLTELATDNCRMRKHMSPLTATVVSRFMKALTGQLRAVPDQDAFATVATLLQLLSAQRDPIPLRRRPELRMLLDRVAVICEPPVKLLDRAIETKQSVEITSDESVDGKLAAALLRRVLHDYFALDTRPAATASDTAFVIHCGCAPPQSRSPQVAISAVAGDTPVSISLAALRFCQCLLMEREHLHQKSFVSVDIETTSNRPESAELLEIGAVRIVEGKVTGDRFRTLVRPSDPDVISQDAYDVHGIRWEDVRHAAAPSTALQQLIAFVGDMPVVGHNILAFDLPILQRSMDENGITDPAWIAVDSYQLARRLQPGEPASLDSLLNREENEYRKRIGHSALLDAELTARAWLRLVDRLQQERELDILADEWPLIAASLLNGRNPATEDEKLICQLGARSLRIASSGQGNADVVDDIQQYGGEELLAQVLNYDAEPLEDDRNWTQLVDQWMDLVKRFTTSDRDQSLDSFLRVLLLATMSDLESKSADRLSLMTVYSAKGHEWPIVFLVGLEDNEFPFASNARPEEVAEGRRALYVGMTRAAERLIMTSVRSFRDEERIPSRFLADLEGKIKTRTVKSE